MLRQTVGVALGAPVVLVAALVTVGVLGGVLVGVSVGVTVAVTATVGGVVGGAVGVIAGPQGSLTLTTMSSIYQPTLPCELSVPSRKRRSRVAPAYGSRLT